MAASQGRRDPSTRYKLNPSPETLSHARERWWAMISVEDRARRLGNFIAAGQKHNKRGSKTVIENIMADMLSEAAVAFERNVQIGRYNVDFLVDGALIIECFGDYWHCNPASYGSEDYNRSLHMTAAAKWSKDQGRRAALERLGYRFQSFWELDIWQHPDQVRRELSELLSTETNRADDLRP